MEPRLTIVTLGVSDLERSVPFTVTDWVCQCARRFPTRSPMWLYGCGLGR